MARAPKAGDRAAVRQFLADNPQIERIELLFPDMNGIFRGKWLPPSGASKLVTGGVRLPISTYGLDIWGRDVDETGLAAGAGDPDGVGVPIPGTLKSVPWTNNTSAQVLMSLETVDREPCVYDPRQRLGAVVARFAELGLTPVVAAELEFYFVKPVRLEGAPPEPPEGAEVSQLYDLDTMDRLEPVLTDIRAACELLGVPVEGVTTEAGHGQFEINLRHLDDAVAAADAAILFRRIVHGCAGVHELEATFMAKPYGDDAGSGMHVHASLVDAAGNNVFSAEDGVGETLRHAVGGALATMRELQAIFAPHFNSYRRFLPGRQAPVSANWGIDHRFAGIRVPEHQGPGARLEHRMAGADCNPYLAIAAILGGMLIGLERKLEPGQPLSEGSSEGRGEKLHHDWLTAVEEFAASEAGAEIFGRQYRRVYAACKRHEIKVLAGMVTDVEYRTYLTRI
ncbi:MAG: glutamine synthetase family protein [Cucumibacter sp.]